MSPPRTAAAMLGGRCCEFGCGVAVGLREAEHPPGEQVPWTVARNTGPSSVSICLKSPTHFWFTRSTVKSRFSRSDSSAACASARVRQCCKSTQMLPIRRLRVRAGQTPPGFAHAALQTLASHRRLHGLLGDRQGRLGPGWARTMGKPQVPPETAKQALTLPSRSARRCWVGDGRRLRCS